MAPFPLAPPHHACMASSLPPLLGHTAPCGQSTIWPPHHRVLFIPLASHPPPHLWSVGYSCKTHYWVLPHSGHILATSSTHHHPHLYSRHNNTMWSASQRPHLALQPPPDKPQLLPTAPHGPVHPTWPSRHGTTWPTTHRSTMRMADCSPQHHMADYSPWPPSSHHGPTWPTSHHGTTWPTSNHGTTWPTAHHGTTCTTWPTSNHMHHMADCSPRHHMHHMADF